MMLKGSAASQLASGGVPGAPARKLSKPIQPGDSWNTATQPSARNRVHWARWSPSRALKSAVANSITASLSSISVASWSPVSRPDNGTTQAPARTTPNITSRISTELPINTATWWPGPMPRACSALATRLMLAVKSPQLRRTGPQTTASLSGWLRPCTSNTSGISTLVSSSTVVGLASLMVVAG